MFKKLITKIFGTKSSRDIKKLQPIVDKINQLEENYINLSNTELSTHSDSLQNRYNDGESLDVLLPEAYALVRETAKRFVKMRPFDVQLIGGIILHQGKIAEMKTGEGKTLAATLPIYLNSLTGKGVHVVTVNDYLARRDAQWMSPIYLTLNRSVGVINPDKCYLVKWDPEKINSTILQECSKKQAYDADITYGTNNEFGFDYLRGNLIYDIKDRVQKEHNFAIIDEVDSILIDEARTPLIISGPAEKNTEKYVIANRMVKKLIPEKDYEFEEKSKTVSLTEEGTRKSEKLLNIDNLYTTKNIEWIHHINQALRANIHFQRDKDYIIKNGQVIIVDEFTGRLMEGRRYSDGLHQALEAKEHVKIEAENQTLATITFQNLFKMYDKLAGMTGTADTEAEELHSIYGLEVVVVPTHKKMIRVDYNDKIYRTLKEKYKAITDEIERLHKKHIPVLVGTTSVENSELISDLLVKKGINHQVLNAKYHEKEAEIVSKAGHKDSVTIATNMAGRGTDIVLDDDIIKCKLCALNENNENTDPNINPDECKQDVPCGLHIIGTERHESRRIDNQLRGRAGRQGDPGASVFYISLEDDLMRLFGSDRISGMMLKLGMEEGQEIHHPWISRAIESAQKKVESHNFDIRKHLLEYDDVMNTQREIVYKERNLILSKKNIKEHILDMIYEYIQHYLLEFTANTKFPEEWNWDGIEKWYNSLFPDLLYQQDYNIDELTYDTFLENVFDKITNCYYKKEEEFGTALMRNLEKNILLEIVDTAWKEHLHNLDNLKEGIGLRAYAHVDPLVAYKNESFDMFQNVLLNIKEELVKLLFSVQVQADTQLEFNRVFEDISNINQGNILTNNKKILPNAENRNNKNIETKKRPKKRKRKRK